MLGRRSLMLGAAAVAVAPATATAQPPLDLVPCDGRVLPICDYPELFRVIRDACGSWSATTLTFCVPDLRGRARVFDEQGLLARGNEDLVEMVIATGKGPLPAGVVIPRARNG